MPDLTWTVKRALAGARSVALPLPVTGKQPGGGSARGLHRHRDRDWQPEVRPSATRVRSGQAFCWTSGLGEY
jgi:hypothetical protein